MMNPTDLHLLSRHGVLWMFAATLGERLGLPLFVTPLLFAAGALSAMGHMHFGLLLVVTTAACLLGDTLWYELGRWKGGALFGLLCRIALQPDSCVRRSELALERHTGISLLWAKWLPGVAHLAVPMAGAARIPRPLPSLQHRRLLRMVGPSADGRLPEHAHRGLARSVCGHRALGGGFGPAGERHPAVARIYRAA